MSKGINWSWAWKRLTHPFRCKGKFDYPGDPTGKLACRKCGTWNWFPIVPKRRKSSATFRRGTHL